MIATTYHNTARREILRGYGVQVVDWPIVLNDNIITSANPSTAIGVHSTPTEPAQNKNLYCYKD